MQRNIIIVLLSVLFLLCLQWETISGLKRGQQCRDQMTETGGYLSSGPRRPFSQLPCCQDCNLCEKTTKKDMKEDRWHEDVTCPACAGQHETIYWYILPYTLTALQGWPDLDQIHQNQRVPMYRTTEPVMDAENPTHVQYTLDALKIDIHQINHNMEALKNDQDTKHHTLMKELKAQIHIDLEQINLKDNMSHRAVANKVPHTHKELHRTCVTHADLRCWIIVVAIQGACLCCVLAILSISNYKVRKGHPDDSSQASMDNAKGMTMICSGTSTHNMVDNTPKPGILTAIGGPEEDETHVKDASESGKHDTFVKGTALLFQQAVQAVDFANYGVQFGLSDHEIHHIVNTQAVTLQEEAAKKYEAWNRDGKRGEESHLRDDIVAERIQQLPRILSQYKRE